MKTRTRLAWAAFACLALLGIGLAAADTEDRPLPEQRVAYQKSMKDGNWKDAYDGFRKLVLNPENDGALAAGDLNNAAACLAQLGRIDEVDELLESAVKTHPRSWRLLVAAANQYMQQQHYGFMVAGEYHRGDKRGGGKLVNTLERDRVRALQLMVEAMPLTRAEDDKSAVADYYQQLAQFLLNNRGFHEAWRLQSKTDLAELPDYEDGYFQYRNWNGAPVDAEGKPVLHHLPDSWEEAKSDGERWRYTLSQAIEHEPRRLNTIRNELAQFYHQQFGVQTMQYIGGFRWFGRGRGDDADEDESGTYALDTLEENETIARLATGIKRFELPDEFNFIRIWQTIAAEPATGMGEHAINQLAQIFENRRQYPKAADYWRQSIEQYGPGHNNYKRQRVEQIVGAWGQFEPVSTQPRGEGATVEFRFRNARKLSLTAHRIKVDKLLDDVKSYLKADPGRLDWQRVNIQNVGWRLVQNNEGAYLGEEAASWVEHLEPREKHFDRRITVKTKLKDPGAYLLKGSVEGGNESHIVLWVTDSAIVRKQLDGQNLYFVADAVDGAPVGGANLEFFGYRQENTGGNRFRVVTTNFAETADADGQVFPDPRDLQNNFSWLVTARDKNGRFSYLGFSGVWTGRIHDQEYKQIKCFVMTDRPVYRPQQKVHFKFWVRHAQYDQENVSQFAGQTFPVEVYNPRGEKFFSETLKADEYGGVEGEFELAADAVLGQYAIQVQPGYQIGGNTFRVEEYKKPEFEVSIKAPSEPVMLGEKITGKIEARYYFGAPVTNATVKYTITRTEHTEDWYPYMGWEWCYGPGYWWYCYDYPWYPGWRDWVGCKRPMPWWWWRGPQAPPEVVAENEVEIGEEGVVEFEIDTAVAKEIHGDQDHKYSVTAEVRDQSRRTIVGNGQVLVARKPFKVFSWVNRGYYRVGDTIHGHFKAHTLDRQPVEGKGELTLLKITYDEKNQPVEMPVRRWDLDTNVEGLADLQLRASAAGQYRLSYQLTDSKNHTIEGGYLFTITGEGFDGKDYRFNDIELIPDKSEYAPGDTVKLQVNTAQEDSTVLLFVRPANGVYLPPKVVRIRGKSTIEEVAVVKKDMPNFFVEAVTVSGSRVYSEAKEIVVPPEKRILNVSIDPNKEAYRPGEKAKVQVRLTDHTGENYQGSAVVSIYDKSLEYIAGGSNVPDIREFFWKWRRHHNPNQETSLDRHEGNIPLKNAVVMAHIGVFGATVADDLDSRETEEMLATSGEGKDKEFARLGGGRGGAMMPQASAVPATAMRKAGPAGADAMMAEGALADHAAGFAQAEGDRQADPGGGESPLVEPTVRSNFADLALWRGAITTDKTGLAEVELDMPENLTGWKIKVWGMGHGTVVGSGDAEVVTRKDLIIRLQAPRFFVQKDEVVLSANVHNYLATEKNVNVSLELDGGLIEPLEGTQLTAQVKVPAGGETRVDWRVKVVAEGTAVIRMKALTDEESDAMEMKFPCFVHGMLKTESWAGTVRPEEASGQVGFRVPAERRVEESVLEIRYSPSLASAMVDALPYMVDYPYGCTEQTLNRFLPTVITQKVLREMNVNLAEVQEKRTNLNAQEIGDDAERAKQWKKFERNPVFDSAEVDRMVKEGVKRLTDMQVSDGGWGWFSGWGERSWPHTTAVVVHGLQIAQQNDVALVPGMLERGEQWLVGYQAQQVQMLKNAPNRIRPWKDTADNLDAFIYMVLVDAGKDHPEMREFLYRDRNNLAVYSKAMFGLALHKQQDQEKLDMMLENISQFVVQDAENETAHLKLPADNHWWYWYGSEIEADAYYLKLLSKTEPRGVTAPRLVKYLLNNRKHATYWHNTRDTAVCIEAFADYIRASGEAQPDMVVEVWLDGQKRKEVEITGENLFTFDNKFVLTGAEVTDGEHTVELRRRGRGPVYFNAYLTNFTLEDPITKAGLEVKVERNYFKLVPVDKRIDAQGSRGQVVDQKVQKFERVPLENLAMLKSGELVEVELVIESKNDYEYLIFEDMKPAGFEAVEVRSGYTANGLGAYTEFRDERVSFFVRALARGKHSIAYRLRAEIPGKFSALPARAYAMYAPELKGNSDELKLQVED